MYRSLKLLSRKQWVGDSPFSFLSILFSLYLGSPVFSGPFPLAFP